MFNARSYLRWAIALFVAMIGFLPARGARLDSCQPAMHALLVGCSHYDNLG